MELLTVLLFYYQALQGENYSKEVIKDYIVVESLIIGVDSQLALNVVNLESRFNHNAVGDKGNSYGLWQIHLPSHPSITKEQALDPIWSTNWALVEIKRNSCKIWSTCVGAKRLLNSQPERLYAQPMAYITPDGS